MSDVMLPGCGGSLLEFGGIKQLERQRVSHLVAFEVELLETYTKKVPFTKFFFEIF